MSSPICWMKNNILSDTSQQTSKKMRKLERPFFKTQKNKKKQEKEM